MGHGDSTDHTHEAHSGGGAHHGEMGHGDQPDVHGMFVCGESSVFFSHLPMFEHEHHDFQVILEVTLREAGAESPASPAGSPAARYVEDRRRSGEKVYTFAPDPFRLPDLVNPAEDRRQTTILGSMFRGHFEKNGSKIFRASARVDNVIHFRQFDRDAEPLDTLQYILFGTGGELFLAHLITQAPDFDHIVAVSVPEVPLSEGALRRGPIVTFAGRENSVAKRLRPEEKVQGVVSNADGSAGTPIELSVLSELYFEEGELASPPTFRPTAEETRAGFA